MDKKKVWWKRRSWQIFIFLNVAGLLLIIPLLRSFPSLIGVWWHTRSQDSFRLSQNESTTPAKMDSHINPNLANPAVVPTNTPNPAIGDLTNQIQTVQELSDNELRKIIAFKFGEKKNPVKEAKTFDQDSAVFEKITSFTTNIDGKISYGYDVVWVDSHGNHETFTDFYDEPNLDYERSKAALELIDRNPQLKRVYQAFSYVLAEKSTAAATSSASTNDPILLPQKPAER